MFDNILSIFLSFVNSLVWWCYTQPIKEEIEEEKRVREEITNELVSTLGDEVLKL